QARLARRGTDFAGQIADAEITSRLTAGGFAVTAKPPAAVHGPLCSRSLRLQVELLELHGEGFAAGADRRQADLELARPDGVDGLEGFPGRAVAGHGAED